MTDLDVTKISLSGWNPRKEFDPKDMNALQESIKQQGICQPLLVRPDPDNGTFQLVAGERRLRAAKNLKLKKVPVMIRDMTDQEVRQVMLIENLERKDLSPMEEATFLKRIVEADGISQNQLAKTLGKPQSWISRRIQLLNAPSEIQSLLMARAITPKHVRILMPFEPYPIWKDILSRLLDQVKDNDEISARFLQSEIILHCLQFDNKSRTLKILDLPWEHNDYERYVDTKDCKKCQRLKSFTDTYQRKSSFCIDRRCFKNKLSLGKQKLEKERIRMLENMHRLKVIDTRLIPSSEYKQIWPSYDEWSKKKCKGCKNKKKTENGGTVCIDPPCYAKSSRNVTRSVDTERILNRRRTWDAVTKFVDSGHVGSFMKTKKKDDEGHFIAPVPILRWLAEQAVKHSHSEQRKHGLKLWPDAIKTGKNSYGYKKTTYDVSKIPDEDLMKFLVIMEAAEEINYLNNFGKDELKKFMPEAVPFFKKAGGKKK